MSTWDPTNNPIVCQAEFPGFYPERSNDLPNGTVDANHLKALLQRATDYPGTNPGALRSRRSSASGCSSARSRRRSRAPTSSRFRPRRRSPALLTPNGGGVQPLLGPRRVGQQLHAVEQPEAVRQPEDGDLRERQSAPTPASTSPACCRATPVTRSSSTSSTPVTRRQAGNITVLPPPDSNVSGGTFADCEIHGTARERAAHRGARSSPRASGCQITGVSQRRRLQRPMGHRQGADPRRLHLRRHRSAWVLDPLAVRVPGRHERDRHDHVGGVHAGRPGSPDRVVLALVVARVLEWHPCRGATPVTGSSLRRRSSPTASAPPVGAPSTLARRTRAVGGASWSRRCGRRRRPRADPVAPEAARRSAGRVPRLPGLAGDRVGGAPVLN